MLLRKAVILSALGHIAVFNIFSFTFGERFIKANYVDSSFLGAILRPADLNSPPFFSSANQVLKGRTNIWLLNNTMTKKGYDLDSRYIKPLASLPADREKIIFRSEKASVSILKMKDASTFTFHPLLPYHFLLYFRDRQRVHIELMFNIISTSKENTILIKRKISSGSLEADLLSMRYINHYLFIQQARFTPNKWQLVKIDLSTEAGHD